MCMCRDEWRMDLDDQEIESEAELLSLMRHATHHVSAAQGYPDSVHAHSMQPRVSSCRGYPSRSQLPAAIFTMTLRLARGEGFKNAFRGEPNR